MQPLPEPEIERIHTEWENEFQGPENAGRIVVGTPGAKLEPWGTNPIDMDYANGWMQLVDFVMGGGFGVPKSIVGMMGDVSYATLFATLKQFHLLTLLPKCSRIAANLTRHLAPFFGDDLIIEIRCPRIDDHEVKNGKLNLLMSAKCITKNELRKELEMPLTKEKWGEEIAGTESQEQQQQMPGMEGMGGVQQPQAPQQQPQQNPQQEEEGNTDFIDEAFGEGEEEDEIARSRPNPGTLNRGSLGPRKNLLLNGHNGYGR